MRKLFGPDSSPAAWPAGKPLGLAPISPWLAERAVLDSQADPTRTAPASDPSPSTTLATSSLASETSSGFVESRIDLRQLGSAAQPLAQGGGGGLAQLSPEAWQAVAQRFGEEVAERVVSQAAQGHFRVRLVLAPEDLGRVDVELQMRDGKLDAALGVQSTAVRDLLNESLPRLREGLHQHGMELANLHVGLSQHGRNGGNPTPWAQAAQPGRTGGATDRSEAAHESQVRQARPGPGGVGWDVWV